MSASAVLSVNAPSAPPPAKGMAAAKASGFDDLLASAEPVADRKEKAASEPRPAHRTKTDAAPADVTATGDEAAAAAATLPAAASSDAVDPAPVVATPAEEDVVSDPEDSAAEDAPKGPVNAAAPHIVLPEPARRDAPVAAGLTRAAAEPLPPPPPPADEAPAEGVLPPAEDRPRGQANAETPPPAAAPALAGALADRAMRRNDAGSNAATAPTGSTPSPEGGRIEASRPEGQEAGPRAAPDAATKPAPDSPTVVAAPVDAPVDQAAATSVETVRTSAEAVADVRETSLSGLAKATIDATAQISAQILRRLEGRSTRFEMSLHPEDLGRVDVKLDIDSEGRLAARLAFDNPAAATDLRGRADDLRRQLEDAGFHMADDAFEFADRDSGSSAFDRGHDARHGQNRAFAAASRLNDEIDVAQPPRWMTLKLSPSGVDMKV